MDHIANLGSVSAQSKTVATGRGPHVYRDLPLQADLGALSGGLVMARDADGNLVPYGTAQETTATGDGSAKTFTFDLVGPVDPGSITVGDGTEAFTDDGFGTLTGDATGSGKVNYATGQVSVTFNAAPANAASISCGYQPSVYGVLARDTRDGDIAAQAVVMGQVHRKELLVGATAPTNAQFRALENSNLWPVG